MAAESSRSSSSADSYIGSLISLTSKSEIRYEGVLYSINTEESSIGLRNVRSFGTEGRKKDGPQVPPSDKVFEYILFRGSDIKDLQVKSSPSPPAQTTTSINSDPAIIQSHYPRPAATSSSLPSAVSGPVTDLSSHTAQLGHPGPGSTFQGGLPLYQPGGNLGSWGPSPPPSANGSGLAMPMYWQGYYGPPNGLPQLHQQSLLRPPPGLSIPPSMQQPMQYSGFHPSLPTGTSNLSGSNLPEYPSPLISTTTNSLNLTSTPLPPSTLSTTLPHVPPVVFAPEALPNPLPNKAPNSAFPPATPNASLPLPSPLTTTSPDISAVVPPITNKPNAISAPTFPYQTPSPPMSSIVGPPSTSHSETLTPSLVTPGQLLQSGKGTISQPLQTAHKDVEVVQVSLASSSSSSEPLVSVSVEAQPPILPLPQPARAGQRMNGGPFQSHGSHHGYRGRERGRGTGSSRPVTKFTEDFDFMAMNEKFKKDEVWGHLGKSNKSNSKDKEVNGIGSDEDDFEDEDDAESSKFGAKQPVYNKDDFFDSLSSNALDRESNSGRTRFSEQMKIDTETFGEFSRYRGGRGGRGPGRGGRFRGSYYGRGYGYPGRGRGRALSGRGL